MAASFAAKAPQDTGVANKKKKAFKQAKKVKPMDSMKLSEKFGIKPKQTQNCKKHRSVPVEFYCEVSHDFYCKLCCKDHLGHDDISINEVASEIQNSLTGLKHIYMTKRMHVLDRLSTHQSKVESFFEIYYELLDTLRKKVLEDEYELRDKMETFEDSMKKMLSRTQSYSLNDYFFEKDSILDEINMMKRHINKFSLYCPSHSINWNEEEDIAAQKEKLQTDLKEKLEQLVIPVDNNFALSNFQYVSQDLGNAKIADIYQMLGPFDYSQYTMEDDGNSDGPDFTQQSMSGASFFMEKRFMQDEFQERKSGARYRGEVHSESYRPDGKGFKVFQGKSLYEGYFSDGMCHGVGRGITSKGDMYQGGFRQDSMDGHGFYVYADGRIYEGEWQNNKKHGKGTYFWPNGQIYRGDFKYDNCFGAGVLFYPDGKRFEGVWRDGKKHGRGIYVFPDGGQYQVIYQEGKKQSEGKVLAGGRSIEEIKNEY